MIKEPGDVLELALQNDELDRFLAGEPFYFLETKDDHDDPQNVIVAFDVLFMPQFKARNTPLPQMFVQALLKLIANYPDRNRALYMAVDWVWCYRYLLQKKQMQPDGPYASLPIIDLSAVANDLKSSLEEQKEDLMRDLRWAGALWNSRLGLWEPLMRTALHVRDKLGGPDFVPKNGRAGLLRQAYTC